MFICFMYILKKLVGHHNINKISTLTKKLNKIWPLTRKVDSKLNQNMSVPCEGAIWILQSYIKEYFVLRRVAHNNDFVFNESQNICNFPNLSWSKSILLTMSMSNMTTMEMSIIRV